MLIWHQLYMNQFPNISYSLEILLCGIPPVEDSFEKEIPAAGQLGSMEEELSYCVQSTTGINNLVCSVSMCPFRRAN